MDDNTNTQDFLGFDDSEVSDVDFFAEAEEQDESKKNPGAEDTNKGNPGSEEEKEKEVIKDEDLFGEAEKDEEDSPEGAEPDNQDGTRDEGDEGDEDIPTGVSITTLAYLKEKGLAEYELEEGETLTEEKAGEILEDSLDGIFEERIEELFENVPDVVKEMNKFVLQGGDINVFLDTVAKQKATGLSADMDLEDEANQEAIIKYGLQEEGYDAEYIEAQLEFLKDSKRLKKHAETHFTKWDTARKEEQTAILASQGRIKEKDKQQRRELKGKVTTFLKDSEEVGGFVVTKSDRKSLPDYMSDRNVKLQNGNQITNMQRDLMRVLNSPTGSVQMAKLLKAASEEGELNFEEIQKNTETKVTKKVRENVRRTKSIIKSVDGKNSRKKLKLADYFD